MSYSERVADSDPLIQVKSDQQGPRGLSLSHGLADHFICSFIHITNKSINKIKVKEGMRLSHLNQ